MVLGGGGMDGKTEGRTDGRLEIPPCVLQDIGPLGPLPKKGKNKAKYAATLVICGLAETTDRHRVCF